MSKENEINELKKGVVSFIVFIVFLVGSIVTACHARHYQIINRPMPNWKGGFMSANGGCRLAAAMFLFSVLASIAAYKSWKGRS